MTNSTWTEAEQARMHAIKDWNGRPATAIRSTQGDWDVALVRKQGQHDSNQPSYPWLCFDRASGQSTRHTTMKAAIRTALRNQK